MTARLRSSLVSFSSLAVYLFVYLAVLGSHHHAETWAPGSGGAPLQVGAGPAEDGDGPHDCPICHVLHLSQNLSPNSSAVSGTVLAARALAGPGPAPARFLPAVTHSRAPPTIPVS